MLAPHGIEGIGKLVAVASIITLCTDARLEIASGAVIRGAVGMSVTNARVRPEARAVPALPDFQLPAFARVR